MHKSYASESGSFGRIPTKLTLVHMCQKRWLGRSLHNLHLPFWSATDVRRVTKFCTEI